MDVQKGVKNNDNINNNKKPSKYSDPSLRWTCLQNMQLNFDTFKSFKMGVATVKLFSKNDKFPWPKFYEYIIMCGPLHLQITWIPSY